MQPLALIELSFVDAAGTPNLKEVEWGAGQFVSRTRLTVPNTIGANRIRLYARWMNRRAEAGPWSLPVEFNPQIAG